MSSNTKDSANDTQDIYQKIQECWDITLYEVKQSFKFNGNYDRYGIRDISCECPTEFKRRNKTIGIQSVLRVNFIDDLQLTDVIRESYQHIDLKYFTISDALKAMLICRILLICKSSNYQNPLQDNDSDYNLLSSIV